MSYSQYSNSAFESGRADPQRVLGREAAHRSTRTLDVIRRKAVTSLELNRIALFAIGIIVLGNPLPVHAQRSLEIAGADVAIGMEQQATLAKFRHYRVGCPGQEGKAVAECASILIQSDQPPHDAYANIVFEKGKVKSILKYWDRGFEGSAPGKFVQTLYSLLSNEGRSATKFQVSVSERRDPGVLLQTIYLTSGRKTISISYAEGLRGADGRTIPPLVNLNEFIE